MFWLEAGPLSSSTTNVVYLTRPKIKWIKIIADQIKRHAREGKQHVYTLFLVPRTSTLVTRVLEEEGVLGEVNVSAFNMQFIPIADDVVSLEHENAFKEIWVDGDETIVYDSAQALVTFQRVYGKFPRIVGKGNCAGRLTGLLSRHLEQATRDSASETLLNSSDKLDSLIILDRRVDMITPMITQLTYQGLIDEELGIKNSHVELPVSIVTPPNPQGASNPPNTSTPAASSLVKEPKKKYHLNASSDPLFGELRDLNFSSVGKTLNKHARRLDEDYKSRLQAKTVAQLRDFVGKLSGLQIDHQSLRLHTGLSELLVPVTRTVRFLKVLEIQQNLLSSYEISTQISAIEDLIAQGESIQMVLRLLCLASIVNGGIKNKVLENLKREILQAYGYEYLPLILSLSSPPLGLILTNPIPSSSASLSALKIPYPSLRKSLRLVAEDEHENPDEPADISYVYSGYAPLSIRLVQCVVQKGGVLSVPGSSDGGDGAKKGKSSALNKARAHPILGWKGFEDVLESLSGETIDVFQAGQNVRGSDAIHSLSLGTGERTSTSVVFFLGGCTYTEIAALRLISRQIQGRRILIATTGIISGSSLITGMASGLEGDVAGKGAVPS
ncbi:Sec1-like protein [Fomitiporia mediterranea MF3/22]|uniref:Sec1-like protein n=1 Tax=Fomitiporia mediterranea (strain MF3/22) TaxID=694068 RepID=UPI00044072A3|nr:Sec1-like protein [Fomitiporia mediterranea MF3/22]EJD03752.1 Sec1-like protein [Fomitiporia mediterranea MF3/22]